MKDLAIPYLFPVIILISKYIYIYFINNKEYQNESKLPCIFYKNFFTKINYSLDLIFLGLTIWGINFYNLKFIGDQIVESKYNIKVIDIFIPSSQVTVILLIIYLINFYYSFNRRKIKSIKIKNDILKKYYIENINAYSFDEKLNHDISDRLIKFIFDPIHIIFGTSFFCFQIGYIEFVKIYFKFNIERFLHI